MSARFLVPMMCALVCACARDDVRELPVAAHRPVVSRSGPSTEVNPRLLRRFRSVAGVTRKSARPEVVALGRMLFSERQLSSEGDVSCASCHHLDGYGVDHRAVSMGTGGRLGHRNAPSVLDTAETIAQFWDGRAPTLEAQVSGPLFDLNEMAMADATAVSARLATPAYSAAFRAAYPGDPEPITLRHVAEAIAAFERGLVTRSRWDAYLGGDAHALSVEEKHGLHVFLEIGCVGCHTGPEVGATMFQKLGAVEPWPNQSDIGRGAITGNPADRMVFKVPSLKNVTETGPYFHDGSVDRLDQAIRLMGEHQLGVELTDAEVAAIMAWLRALTGTVDPEYVRG